MQLSRWGSSLLSLSLKSKGIAGNRELGELLLYWQRQSKQKEPVSSGQLHLFFCYYKHFSLFFFLFLLLPSSSLRHGACQAEKENLKLLALRPGRGGKHSFYCQIGRSRGYRGAKGRYGWGWSGTREGGTQGVKEAHWIN